MKALFTHRAEVQKISGDLAITIDGLVTSQNTMPMEIGESKIRSGTLSPEGRQVGNPGDLFLHTNNAPGGALWVKQAGLNTTTGWVAFDYREGPFTPVDASGAGLAIGINSAVYTKVGRRVDYSLQIAYPATASGAAAIIGGLPIPTEAINTSVCIGFQSGGPAALQARLQGTTGQINFTIAVTAAAATNAQLTGSFIVLSGSYRSAT